jgi:hypothetical protein
MTSDKKAEASRQNAAKSTGPKTPEGKKAVRLNALKHGLLAEEAVLGEEDAGVFDELGENLRAELQPVGELENLLVDRITAAYWRLRRVRRVEAGIFAWERYEELAERAEREARSYVWDVPTDAYQAPQTRIVDEKRYDAALMRAYQMRKEQEGENLTLGRTFARDADRANAFSKLSRYETAIERQLYRALHELERRQAARLGGNAPPPQVVDVDVSAMPEG